MKYAFFDLDKTITRKDTGMAFLAFWIKKHPGGLWRIFAAPLLVLLWKLRILPLSKLKEFFFGVLKGHSRKYIEEEARHFVETIFPSICKPGALAAIRELKHHGYTIILASASPEIYVTILAKKLGINLVAGTRYEFIIGYCTGRMDGPDCRGEEKIARISALINIPATPLPGSLAYSDSKADLPLLSLAEQAFMVHPRRWELWPVG